MSVRDLLIVATGGAVGAVARHGTGVLCAAMWGTRFPWGTLIVNVLGCFMLGWLLHEAEHVNVFGDTTKLAIGTGFLGAMTTFSTFGVQTVQVWSRSPSTAMLNVAGNLVLGLIAAAIGIYLATQFHGTGNNP